MLIQHSSSTNRSSKNKTKQSNRIKYNQLENLLHNENVPAMYNSDNRTTYPQNSSTAQTSLFTGNILPAATGNKKLEIIHLSSHRKTRSHRLPALTTLAVLVAMHWTPFNVSLSPMILPAAPLVALRLVPLSIVPVREVSPAVPFPVRMVSVVGSSIEVIPVIRWITIVARGVPTRVRQSITPTRVVIAPVIKRFFLHSPSRIRC
jgi:hypothetical protein